MSRRDNTMRTLSKSIMQELLRHKMLPFNKSKVAKFSPRLSITAGLGEKIADKVVTQKGQTLSYLLTDGSLPSSEKDNPYVHLTKKGGNRSFEARLAKRLAAARHELDAAGMLKEALDVCNDDYWTATLTLHNLLKEITYAERGFGDAVVGWDKATNKKAEYWVTCGDPATIIDKVPNLRPTGDRFHSDKMAIYYHTFGLFFVGGITSGSEAQALAWMENATRKLGLGSKEDAYKMAMNTWASSFSHSINAMLEQHLCVPEDLSSLSVDDLKKLLETLKGKHRTMQGNLENSSHLLQACLAAGNEPNLYGLKEAMEANMEIIRDQQAAIARDGCRVQDEITRRIFEQVHAQPEL